MNLNKELLTIYMTASLYKFLRAANVGVPLRFMQMGDEKDQQVQDEVQIITDIDFIDRGGQSEFYALLHVQALVKTKIVPTDVYYHTRVKARMADVLDRIIPLMRVGGTDAVLYPKDTIGIMRRVPAEMITVTPTSVREPDGSLVQTCFEIQLCE